MDSIWCLFSIENNYDQPDNNLVMWWATKPSLDTVIFIPGRQFDSQDARRLLNGEQVRHGNYDYRIREVFQKTEV